MTNTLASFITKRIIFKNSSVPIPSRELSNTSSIINRLVFTEFLKIIRFVIKDANVFVISHKADLHDKFNSVIRFEKVKGFSRICS